MKNRIGITMGDPLGIGPEIIARAWKSLTTEERAFTVIYGDRAVIAAACEFAGIDIDQKRIVITSNTSQPARKVEELEAARLATSALDAAMEDALTGKIAAIVTAPVSKKRIQLITPSFTGHTEHLARRAKVRDAVMMFASDGEKPEGVPALNKRFCLSLVTTHIPLKEVAASVTKARVLTAIRQTALALGHYFACPDARIAVMALNPHGGEAGHMGLEEKKVIAPAVESALKEGVNCVGPLPADGLFNNLDNFDYDAVIAMYHDQGMIPVKLLSQKRSVNLTLGLPYIRTSPAHGTAEDIAWLGNADETSMLCAIRLARQMVGVRGDK